MANKYLQQNTSNEREFLVIDPADLTEAAQDSIGSMVDATLVYVDATPSLGRAALTGDVTSSAGSNTTAIAAGVIINADINASAAIDATKIADGTVTSTEFQYINTLSSNAQTQLDAKLDDSQATAFGLSLLDDANAAAAITTLGLDNTKIRSVGITIDGGGSVISTGLKGYIEVPYACTINRITMLADVSGSAVCDLWVDSYANYPPTVADTIVASAKPTITTATKSQDSTLTGWSTSITAGSILGFNIDSCTSITRLHIILKVTTT